MRLFFYYALHTFKNQLKKLFKTWVAVFIVACMVIGGLIGFGAAKISDLAEENAVEDTAEQESPFPEGSPFSSELFHSKGFLELMIGGVILLLFVIDALSADKNGSSIFVPADVNLLFSSPMQPQSVLMFRLMTQIGMSLVAGIYLLFQLPNLTLNMGLSLWAALSLIFGLVLTIIFAKLIQVLLYTFGSVHPGFMKRMRYGIYAILAAIALAFVLYWKAGNQSILDAAFGFFNAKGTRLIPLWGWIKGFCMYVTEGSLLGALLCLGALLAGGAALIFVIRRIPADFYEDAMAKSEETAALLRQAQESRFGVARRKKKDRSDRLTRDGLNHGWGASVFFHKAMYNRFRFAHFHIFTKTAETYFFAALAVSVLLRFWIEKPDLTVVACILAVIAFFRSLGNPLAQDTKMDYFILIPESAHKKMFWSLLGGTANCALDLLPGMLLAVILLGANPLMAVAWIIFIVSVDFYSTNVGVFLDVSLPASTSKTVKQVIQIMFLYFGLLPDIALVAVGIVMHKVALFAACATVVNLILGAIFFAFTPSFLEPKGGSRPTSKTRNFDNPEPIGLSLEESRLAKKQFSKMGFAVLAIWVIWAGLTTVCYPLMDKLFPGWDSNTWLTFLYSDIPLYLIGLPVGMLIFRTVPAHRGQAHTLPVGKFFAYFAVCQFMMYAGNLVGLGVSNLVDKLFGITPYNPLDAVFENSSIWARLIFAAILAPVVEEFLFRRTLIDRMRPYGEKLAVILSALLFGLFHGNLSQFFYAFFVGLVLGYLYLRSNRLRYTILLHAMANTLGGVIGPYLMEKLQATGAADLSMEEIAKMEDLSALGGTGVFVLYALVLMGVAIAGLVILCTRFKKVVFLPAERQLAKDQVFPVSIVNPGMILAILFGLGMIARTILLSA